MKRLALLLLTSIPFAGCFTDVPNLCDNGNCGPGDGGTSSGDAKADVVAPPGCDLNKDPVDSAACVDDGVGIFVDGAKGSDTNPGTKAGPVKTVSKAVDIAGNKRVYVCEGTYPDALVVKAKAAVYGGFACTDWKPGTASVLIAPSQQGYALDIQKAVGGVLLVDLAFEARSGTESAPNSIAARVEGTTDVTLRRVSLTAKDGATGKTGDGGTTGAYVAPEGGSGNGKPAGAAAPGGAKSCTCTTGGGSTVGASGANEGAASGSQGGPNLPENPIGQIPPQNGAGGTGTPNCIAGPAHNGANAAAAG
ncbi:MAG: hypothetical protein HOO96_43935, partial [Polyangiaceae bacterium]|nr:hypothetical protein [Polyangiaceae bacterium]